MKIKARLIKASRTYKFIIKSQIIYLRYFFNNFERLTLALFFWPFFELFYIVAITNGKNQFTHPLLNYLYVNPIISVWYTFFIAKYKKLSL